MRFWFGFILVMIGSSALAQEVEALSAEARAIAATLTQQLGAALKQELAAQGPTGAVQVCKSLAPQIAAALSNQHALKVTRVSLKPRNLLLGSADAWEQQQLATFDAKAAAGEAAEPLEYAAIVDEPAGKYFRYVKALPVQPLCLSCHGDAQSVPQAVREQLAKDYPADRATGYRAGQIRGAVSIKKPL